MTHQDKKLEELIRQTERKLEYLHLVKPLHKLRAILERMPMDIPEEISPEIVDLAHAAMQEIALIAMPNKQTNHIQTQQPTIPVKVYPPAGSRKRDKSNPTMADKILEVLTSGPATPREIAELLDANLTTVGTTFNTLFKNKKVTRVEEDRTFKYSLPS